MAGARNPRREAAARLGDGSDVRVLEPSPPANSEPPFFADDPVAGGEVLPIRRAATRTWQDLCDERGDPVLRAWCATNWLLGPASQSLEPVPRGFAAARAAWHAVAEHISAPRRYQATGRIGLRFTVGGFGTPFFGADNQLRLDGTELVDTERRRRLTTLGELAEFAGVRLSETTGVYEPSTPADPGTSIEVSPDASRVLANWFGFSAATLEQLRADADADEAPSRVQLWPEHFDMAVELGREGERANFGGSPGDAEHPEPYLYIGPWEQRNGEFWNEPFGASLSYREIVDGADPLSFLRAGRSELGAAR